MPPKKQSTEDISQEENLSNEDKLKLLDSILTKKYGDSYYGKKRKIEDIKFISTGCLSLDEVLGKGVAESRLIELYGPESSAKSTIAQTIVASFQRQGKICAYIDAEFALDTKYAAMLGVDIDSLIIIQGKNAEENLEALRTLTSCGYVSFVVVDSVASLVPKVIMEKGVDESTMALLARYMSAVTPQVVSYCGKSKCSVLYINQLRASMNMYGPSTSTSGGNSLKYYASTRLETKRGKPIKKDGKDVGITVELKAAKNKCSRPFISRELTILFPYKNSDGEWVAGIDWFSDLVDTAIDRDIIIKTGSYFQYGSLRTQGLETFKEALSKEPTLIESIRTKLYDEEYIEEYDGTEEEIQAA
ncbi:DNA recombination/repair protein RecA [Calothrix sp. FACHB-1219]|uniref:recombinase RecA n=1 Tax=unclassified Calothrix TaxID=2619626 RepID=UPI001688F389|nr:MULTISPECIES: DNA recombination/repair protein RecA [unclassified Calothrix]MBD2201763.1 DNA recombination/repair protein RecA [Calothrix sp. FACHB-168]MBD2217449.1 DNA recombination/repair protein RecA [Calothrix sp. FACHB-1219]